MALIIHVAPYVNKGMPIKLDMIIQVILRKRTSEPGSIGLNDLLDGEFLTV
jgi:hypothetical protein